MSRTNKNSHILGVAPCTRGFGFALFDGDKLINWGVKTASGNKNRESLAKLKSLIVHYTPGVIVLEDASAKDSRRSARIRKLGVQLVALAKSQKVKMTLFSRTQVRKAFFAGGQGTKDALAEIVANRFPEELGSRLPRKRLLWMSEAYQMAI